MLLVESQEADQGAEHRIDRKGCSVRVQVRIQVRVLAQDEEPAAEHGPQALHRTVVAQRSEAGYMQTGHSRFDLERLPCPAVENPVVEHPVVEDSVAGSSVAGSSVAGSSVAENQVGGGLLMAP